MNSANKLNAYRVNAVSTASAENLVVMLYDGAIRFMGMAIRAFEKDDPLDFNLTVHTNISKTQAIIRELSASLDVEKAGDLGHSLISLYDYFDTRLQEANIHKDKAILEEIIERISELRDAWSESFNKTDEEAHAAAPPHTQAYAPNTNTPPAPTPAPNPTPVPGERPGFSVMG